MELRKQSLGRMAVILPPSLKLKQRLASGATAEKKVHDFLLGEFGGYTVTSGNIFGYWRADDGTEFYGEHREYKAAFAGKDRIPKLEEFLARLTAEIGEKCIYVETGEDAWFVYAKATV